ncbi:hypothetical protein PT094_03465 [Erysipelothrix rhusiopathiae]|uniref:hypothetical protein n=1 Tax=Erysipelothrix rhusiopathiae TaxID=1648 RepID=UPI001EE123C1|nr:hypothetical protein [Erysipelothrix rhusiopathiae]MCG4435793.1 hypothetical protein [Erysipelothrix rhusiopathiae]MDE8051069.1 hypothetical protein [Erysipelothrix rhusiopathiae]MDE8061717.1 hypothetical protein [Erysipelothrix rhusiopathiae]MDE8074687.1 hypothetical protein [Erysipelothrix rhusiopathiae]MDE8129074.1 hypothetical protein [Erysipelothrix rhusiopathiae]
MKIYLKECFFRDRLLGGLVILIGDLLLFVSFRNTMSFEMLISIWFVASCVIMGVFLKNTTQTFQDENHLIQLKSLGFSSNEIKQEFEHFVMISFILLIIMRMILILLTNTFSPKRLLILVLALLSYNAILKWSTNNII